jgi:predicted polyphosphate/ATP-dependent NAD kinase
VTGIASLGVVVNPIAGMGGRVGLHGTDGATLAEAVQSGAEPVAPARARRALDRLRELMPALSVLTVAGPMGGDLMPNGWSVELVTHPSSGPTTAADTRSAVAAMVDRGVQLILFGGGDGTARDVAAVTGLAVPIIGAPCGVKMHSGVFAIGPEAAGEAGARFLTRPGAVGQAEILDADADGARLFSIASVPQLAGALQSPKVAGSTAADGDIVGLGRAIAAEMRPGRMYLLGPGTTVASVSEALGIPASIRGVDVVIDGAVVATDAGERELLGLLVDHPAASLVLGVVGGQGFLFGRGNQQLSAEVLQAVGPGNIEIIADAGKVAALNPPVLRIDLDDCRVREQLTGYRTVRTSRRRSTVLRVVA